MNQEKKNLLVFGYGLAVIICFFVWRHSVKHGSIGPISTFFLIIAALSFLTTLVNYRLLIPVYDKWMIGAHFIGKTILTVLLTLFFYFIFGIAGIVLRLMGKDLLDQKLEPDRKSYWNKRPEIEFDPAHYENQF